MPRKRSRGVRRSEEQWIEILRRFESSGLGSRQFCHRDGLPLSIEVALDDARRVRSGAGVARLGAD